MKICPKCKIKKATDAFAKNVRAADGLQYACRECMNARARERNKENPEAARAAGRKYYNSHKEEVRVSWLRAAYDLAPGQYDEMLAAQGGVCAVCHEKPEKVLCVDHDHVTGRVRGLLCKRCNQAAGLLKDDPARADALGTYLRKTLNLGK